MIPSDAFRHTLRELFAPIATHLGSTEVTGILINGSREIYVEQGGRLLRTSDSFASEAALLAAVRNLAQSVGREIGPHAPVLEARFPGGAQVQVVVPPAAPSGPVLSIRQVSEVTATLDALSESGALSPVASGLLRQAVFRKSNVLIVGPSGSGKTTVLAAMASVVDPSERIVVVEKVSELRLTLPHLVMLEATSRSPGSGAPLTLQDLLPAAMRLRPDRLFVGEVCGEEALDFVLAMSSGKRGSLSTLRAASPVDGLRRLEALALAADPNADRCLLRRAVASAVDVVVEADRRSDGHFVVSRISGIRPDESVAGYRIRDLFVSDLAPGAATQHPASTTRPAADPQAGQGP